MSEPAPSAPPPLLRRLPLPRWEPPYDDEVGADVATGLLALPASPGAGAGHSGVVGATALALPLELPAPRRALRLVPDRLPPARAAGAPLVLGGDADDDPDERLPRTPRARLPEPQPWAARFVQVLLEVLAGERPASQVLRHVSLDVYADLVATPPRAVGGRARPARAGSVVSVRVSEPDDGVAEVCAVTRRGQRHRALALRLEGQGGRWRCVALEVG